MILKITRLSKILASKVFRANNNEVFGSNGVRINKTVKNSAKFKYIKKLLKVKNFCKSQAFEIT